MANLWKLLDTIRIALCAASCVNVQFAVQCQLVELVSRYITLFRNRALNYSNGSVAIKVLQCVVHTCGEIIAVGWTTGSSEWGYTPMCSRIQNLLKSSCWPTFRGETYTISIALNVKLWPRSRQTSGQVMGWWSCIISCEFFCSIRVWPTVKSCRLTRSGQLHKFCISAQFESHKTIACVACDILLTVTFCWQWHSVGSDILLTATFCWQWHSVSSDMLLTVTPETAGLTYRSNCTRDRDHMLCKELWLLNIA